MVAQAGLSVVTTQWHIAKNLYGKLSNMARGINFRCFSRCGQLDWADALIKRDEPGDLQPARQIFQESPEDYIDMGAPDFVNRIESRLEKLAGGNS
jgi:hypothetical protein